MRFDPAAHLLVVADTVERVCRCDVFRCLDSAPYPGMMADYIRQHRPDLADAVADALAEISREK